MQERSYKPLPGWPTLPLVIGFHFLSAYLVYVLIQAGNAKDWTTFTFWLIADLLLWLASGLSWAGFFVVEPYGSKVLLLFGRYKGTVKESGFHWANPFFSKRSLSLRVRTLNGERIKVNDLTGNPVEIAAVIVWQVVDTFKASFEVDNYEQYVAVQTETSLRHSASSYPYDAEDETTSLRRNTTEVSEHLQQEVQEQLSRAGLKVLQARLSHLAYASEIAGAMLRRQQAAAIIAARQRIVEGACGMVEMALDRLEKTDTLKLDEERRASMVTNLMVVLCSEHAAQPVVNTGTLYH